ncbi:hypothetical protein CRG98_019125 [Punica granatum]|uniref:Uncharacterized protein n=1 Tax=Punica granatum TaxID=22663 RepID=A0A2I0JVZ6_PUNGR|nr:hypothetical protein CRG98_019125 [Punica granatum]
MAPRKLVTLEPEEATHPKDVATNVNQETQPKCIPGAKPRRWRHKVECQSRPTRFSDKDFLMFLATLTRTRADVDVIDYVETELA